MVIISNHEKLKKLSQLTIYYVAIGVYEVQNHELGVK